MPPKARDSNEQKRGDGSREPIPFDEALRRLVNAPPKHKLAKKPEAKKKPKK